jgi:hypothetical protein
LAADNQIRHACPDSILPTSLSMLMARAALMVCIREWDSTQVGTFLAPQDSR